jgi:hypothetical protein
MNREAVDGSRGDSRILGDFSSPARSRPRSSETVHGVGHGRGRFDPGAAAANSFRTAAANSFSGSGSGSASDSVRFSASVSAGHRYGHRNPETVPGHRGRARTEALRVTWFSDAPACRRVRRSSRLRSGSPPCGGVWRSSSSVGLGHLRASRRPAWWLWRAFPWRHSRGSPTRHCAHRNSNAGGTMPCTARPPVREFSCSAGPVILVLRGVREGA